MADPAEQELARKPWDQQPGEPQMWYARFKMYLALGPLRTYRAAYKQVTGARGGKVQVHTPQTWYTHPNQWGWRERANAWDVYQRNLLALSERDLRVALRQRRVNTVEDTLETIRSALDTADIAAADQDLARQWLPQLRVFLRDMLVVERQEFEKLDYEKDDVNNALAITADDLRAAQREMEKQAPVYGPPVPAPAGPAPAGPKGRTLLVCAGADSGLLLDLPALRAVRAATGLRFTRVLDATRSKFDRVLRIERRLGRPVEWVHLAMHGSQQGVQFVDGVADSNWLSERLLGVQVLLLAACESDGVGEWLGVVPYVISLREDILHEDAAALAQHFWHGIGSGKEPGDALDEALSHCPPVVGEYVVRHW